MPNQSLPTTVFLADDSPLIRVRVAAVLAERGIRIVGESGTPQGCIDGILATRPDVVVLDIQLEGGTGLDVLRTVRAVQPGVAFVVFTINADGIYRERYAAEGAHHFLDKAIEFHQLADAIEEAAAAARQEQEGR